MRLKAMKIAVIGADGQLGSDLVKSLADRAACFPLYYPDFDLTKPAGVLSKLSKLDCNVIINTARTVLKKPSPSTPLPSGILPGHVKNLIYSSFIIQRIMFSTAERIVLMRRMTVRLR